MRKSGLKGIHISMVLFMVFLFLFAPSRIVRYMSLIFPIILIISFLISKITPYLLMIKRTDKLVRGILRRDMPVSLQIVNRGPIPISTFTVSDFYGELYSDSGTFLVSLPAYGKETLTYGVNGHHRGEYDLGPVTLRGTDPLGIFPWTCRIDSRSKVIVYPSIYRMILQYGQGLPAGTLPTKNMMYEDVTQFRSLREYMPGDDMKRINWKVSARTNKIYTMEFEANLYFNVLILLNFSREDYPKQRRDALIERAAETAASLAFYYAQEKQDIGFITDGIYQGDDEPQIVPFKSGYEHAQRIIEIIAVLKARTGRCDFSDLLFNSGATMPLGTRLMVVSPHLSESQGEILMGLKRKGMDILMLGIESATEEAKDDETGGVVKIIPVHELGREMISG